MLDVFYEYRNKNVCLFTKSGFQLTGKLNALELKRNNYNPVWFVEDKLSNKHYFDSDDISHFWCEEDKPIE